MALVPRFWALGQPTSRRALGECGMDRPSIDRSLRLERTATIYLRDRDGPYGEAFIRRLRAMAIRDRPISARSSCQNGFAERLIGCIQRDCLDRVVICGEQHLCHLLSAYLQYYNEARPHLSVAKDAPIPCEVKWIGRVLAQPILGGLHHRYVRV
jgi:transposase InsO family protein